MTVNVLAFGITREIVGSHVLAIELPEQARIGDLKQLLEERYPALRQLPSLLIAQNRDFAGTQEQIMPGTELALIPPVSGG